MYWLTIFVLLSCVASQRLVGAVRRGESPSGRSFFFDSYDRPPMEEFEESEDDLRDAVLMQPEQVLDVPPIAVERDYEMADLDAEEPLPEDRPYESARDYQKSRGFFHDLMQHIQEAFSTWPPRPHGHVSQTPEYHYLLDHSLLDTQQADLKLLLATVEEKTCITIVESEESPKIVFMGVQGCSIEAVENKIVIGYECFEPTMILKLIFRLFGFCAPKSPALTFKSNCIHEDSYRSKMQRKDKEDSECQDAFGFCMYVAGRNSSFPCIHQPNFQKTLCPRTCRICGDSCVDYDSNCNTPDILKDCLSNWEQKKVGCANTCGLCKHRKESTICVDYWPCCQYYAKRNYCKKLPEMMNKFCGPSCGYCKPKSCVDLRTDCSELKKLGGCEKMPDLMGKNCQRTCNFCENGLANRENEYRRPPENCNPDDDFVHKYCSWNTFIVD